MQAKNGSAVKIHYTGFLEDGKVFDSSEGKDPIEFIVGEKKVIKGISSALVGMKKGEEKEITLEPDQAYGNVIDKLQKWVEKKMFGKQKITQGLLLNINLSNGKSMPGKVVKIDGEKVLIDMNHPLAGKTLKFKINLVEVAK